MRASILLASACAAMVAATPMEKRDEVVVTSYDIVYETKIVTVTLGQDNIKAAVATSTTTRRRGNRKTRTRTSPSAAASTPAAVPVASAATVVTPASTVEAAPSSSVAPAPVSQAPAPVVSAAPEPSSEAPAPAPAPASSEAPAPAPSSSAAPPAASPAPDTSSSSTGSSTATTYQQAAIQRHNLHRANHGAGPVIWSQSLADAALIDAKKCTFKHWPAHDGMSYGQNLALGSGPGDIGGIITAQWYGEEPKFAAGGNYGVAQPNYGTNMDLFEQWGHFTQVVWKSTTQIGCATWQCSSVSDANGNPMPAYTPLVTYCFYSSPGNFAGQYASNVAKPASTAVIPNDQGLDVGAIVSSYGSITGQTYSS